MTWYAVYTKPNAEELTARLLQSAGIETLAPRISTKKYARKKFTEVIEPLFPCYIFALFEGDRHGHMIKYTRGVRYIVGKEHPLAVPDEIINAIKERMQGDIVSPVLEQFDKGDNVIIREGPFRDFLGIFERDIPGKKRAMILLSALHCRFEVDARSIGKV